MREIKMVELFGGIGAPRNGANNEGINIKVVDYVEIDKYAVNSYNAIYDENYTTQDICEYNKTFEDLDIIVHGSPCTDFSIAGLGAGGQEDSGTRSSLLYQTLRIVQQNNPKCIIWENVKNVLSKKHKPVFDDYCERLNQLGYNNYYEVLNAKDFGVPQNRERIFCVSIRKDIDNLTFKFPQKMELDIFLRNIIEKEVDQKYYYSKDRVKSIKEKLENFYKVKDDINKLDFVGDLDINDYDYKKRVYGENGISPTLTTNSKTNILQYIGDLDLKIHESARRVYSIDGLAPTLNTCQGGNLQAKIAHCVSSREFSGFKNECPTLCARDYKDPKCTVLSNDEEWIIRKLTPLEYWRLMGFSDEDFKKAEKVCSNSQLYKQAGNSIVTNVIGKIIKNVAEIIE